VKFRVLPQFKTDWGRMSDAEQKKFHEALKSFVPAVDEYAQSPGTYRWPAALRVKPMKGESGIWEMTWSFSGPDGRATFDFETVDGELRLRWRRVGRHGVYKIP
jgi:hypothetical protein